MQTEIEAKFLNIDHDVMRRQLKSAGAVLEHPMRLMRRTMFDYPDGRLQREQWGRLRVRDEVDKITITYKFGDSGSYSQEIETTVGSYETTVELLLSIGLKAYCTQESKRETWRLGDVEVVLDQWPWIKSYIEIEGPSEPAIQAVAAQLGLDWSDALFGNVDTVYRLEYPGITVNETVGAVAELTFDGEMPKWLADRQSRQI